VSEHAVRLTIDPEFQRLIQPLEADERAQLEANLLAEGCRDPLVVWGVTLLDGHHRYAICTEHGIGFAEVQAPVKDRDGAKRWMLFNQLGRRNLSRSALADLSGRLYEEAKKPGGVRGGGKKLPHNEGAFSDEPTETAEAIAKVTGKSRATVERDAAYKRALDVLEKAVPDVRVRIHGRDSKLGKGLKPKDAVQLAKQPVKVQRAVIAMVESGEMKNATAALQAIKRKQRQAEAKPATSGTYVVITGDAVQAVGELPDASVDLVVTDPPYGIETHRTREGGHDYADGKSYALDLLNRVAAALVPKLTPEAHVYVFSGYTHSAAFHEILGCYFDVQENPLIWVKNRQTMCDASMSYASRHEYIWFCRQRGSRRVLAEPGSDVLEFDAQRGTGHSAEKPVDLLSYLISQSSVAGETVLDPFCGSGSSGEAAAKSGRAFVGVEIDPEWAEVARGRGV